MRAYRIDWDTRVIIIKYIRKYDEYVYRYAAEKECAISPSHANDGMPRPMSTTDPTLDAAMRLDKLEQEHYVKVIHAIDFAKEGIGSDIVSDAEREYLRKAIWLSCLNSRDYNFNAFAGFICCERATFYNYKNEFLNNIKFMLGL